MLVLSCVKSQSGVILEILHASFIEGAARAARAARAREIPTHTVRALEE